MKLTSRYRVEGTGITIGKRTYKTNGQVRFSKNYSAEYRDDDGKQYSRKLGTSNRNQAIKMAVELQLQLDKGIEQQSSYNISIEELVQSYFDIILAKGVAPKTIAKYRTDLDKLKDFCKTKKIRQAKRFSEDDLYMYRKYLSDIGYADKTVQGAVFLAKQVFKWAWRKGIIEQYRLISANFPKAKARPQPCFTTHQVEKLIEAAKKDEKLAFAFMAYAGLRIGEVEQLQWDDIVIKNGKPAMLHIRRGGSNGTTKDRDDRFVPIHPRIKYLLEEKRMTAGRLLPKLTERRLLARLKQLCSDCGFDEPRQYKLHTFRHHFASMCANHGIAHRKALAWLGHSSSDMLDLYYHLSDEDSLSSMKELAESHNQWQDDDFEGILRAEGKSKIGNNPQLLELQELISVILQENKKAERGGFEPPVQV